MRKVRITLPATISDLGPGCEALGLAIGLRAQIEIIERPDQQLIVDTAGEGAGHYSIGLSHPVALAMMRVFQRMERAPLGVHIRVDNQIPLESGLGAEGAFTIAGVIGANNLLGNPFNREQVLEIAAQISRRPPGIVAAMLGGLASGALDGDRLSYRALPITAFRTVIVLPELDDYPRDPAAILPERVQMADALHNLARLPLLIDGLRSGDLKLAARTLDDRLRQPFLRRHITGYSSVAEIAGRAGALALTISGRGPALLALTEANHDRLAEALVMAFDQAGVRARAWVLPVDTQGIVISVVRSA